MEVDNNTRRVCKEKISECVTRCNRIYNIKMDIPTLSFKLKGTTAGYAQYDIHTVKLNPVFLMENTRDMIEDTIPHEVAHLVVYAVYFVRMRTYPKPHGNEWKSVMFALGLNPTRCHNYDMGTVYAQRAENRRKNRRTEIEL